MVDETCAVLVDVPLAWDRLHTPAGRQLAESVRTLAGRLDAFSRAARMRAEKMFDERIWLERHGNIFRGLLAAR